MKKLFTIVVLSMLVTMNINAQEGYDDTKHEFALTYGIGSNSQWIDMFEEVGGAMFGGKYENEKSFGSLSAEYFYHLKNWLSVGGIFAYGNSSQDMMNSSTKYAENSNSYFTLMPAVKFDWLRKKHFGLYSKLALGATLRTEKTDYEDPDEDNYSESDILFNWQASLIGVEAGSTTFRGFAELGLGEQGILILGLRYKF